MLERRSRGQSGRPPACMLQKNGGLSLARGSGPRVFRSRGFGPPRPPWWGGRGRRSVWSVAGWVGGVAELVGAGIGACAVGGEIAGFSRAAGGDCYFNLKDGEGAPAGIGGGMFGGGASLLGFAPADGQLVEVR